jgi:hypothetical protein
LPVFADFDLTAPVLVRFSPAITFFMKTLLDKKYSLPTAVVNRSVLFQACLAEMLICCVVSAAQCHGQALRSTH